MRIGVIVGATEGPESALDGLVEQAERLEESGFSTLWMANIFGLEAISSLAIVGRETSRIELGTAAASEAGRPEPRVIAGFPVLLTNKPDAAREAIGKALVIYGQLPSYRAMLDREGVQGPADIALVGDEAALSQSLDELRDAGVTDFNAAIMPVEEGAGERTVEFLASMSG